MIVQTLLYLGYKLDIDFVADTDSVRWFITPPLQSQIDAAVLPAAKASRISSINAQATARILAAYPLEKQSSALMGVYPTAYRYQMTADIASVIQASNTACDAVTAAVDVAGVDAVSVSWPVIGV